mgnify:CR=1 FL=1
MPPVRAAIFVSLGFWKIKKTLQEALRAVVPDLVTIVDSETAHAIPTERLAYGQRVSVIACEAPPALTTPEALAIVGPDQFGLSEQYRPLGEMQEDGS